MIKSIASRVLCWLGRAANAANRTSQSAQCQRVVSILGKAAAEVSPSVIAAAALPHHRCDRDTWNVWKAIVACAPSVFCTPRENDSARYYRSLFETNEPSEEPSEESYEATEARCSVRDSTLQSQPAPVESAMRRLYFTGTGRLMLGLGTLGVFAHSNSHREAFSRVDTNRATGNHQSQDNWFKRQLFQNLNDMFGLEQSEQAPRERSPSVSHAADVPVKEETKRVEEDAPMSTEKENVFERLVVGERLVLRKGDITPAQWKALSEFLKSCPHIRSLRLQNIEITAKDAEELGPGLNQIRNITFCDNSIGLNEGSLEVLVALLLCCGMLESTCIIRNSIADQHIPHILSLLTQHSSLTRISLSWNGISDDGATKLASVIENLRNSMKDLDLSYNLIGSPGKCLLQEAVKRRFVKYGTSVPYLSLQLHHNESLIEYKRRIMRERSAASIPPFHPSPVYFGSDPPWEYGTRKENESPTLSMSAKRH